MLALHATPAAAPLCLAGATGGSAAERLRAAWASGSFERALLGWCLMTSAMMTPLTLPLLRHVAARSFAPRRHRAAGLCLVGALAPWPLTGLGWLLLLAAAPSWTNSSLRIAACGFLLAALWQLAPMKRRALQRCHRTLPLSPQGWRADLDCVRQGLAHAHACVTSCWALMLVMTLAPYQILIAVCVQGIALAERRNCRPPLQPIAMTLACFAAITLAATLL
jgi:predicted metal-binding membrane protein